jgi:hypothetical protein
METSLSNSQMQSAPNKARLWLPSALIVAALGPYLGSSGLKLEHVVIYGTFCGFLVLHSNLFRFRPWGYFSAMMYFWLGLGICQLIGSVWSSSLAREAPTTGRVLAAVEHQVQPLVVVALVCAWAKTISADELTTALRRTVNVLVWALCLNSFLILWCMRTGSLGLFLPWIPSNGAESDSVWVLSVEMGRLGGIFNQPFEAGLCYSIGLLAWCWQQGERRRSALWELGRLVLLLFGGLISVSKVFIFGGIPLAVIFSLMSKTRRMRIFNLKSAAVLTGVMIYAVTVSELWSGFEFFMRLFVPEKGTDLVDLYTANRFGGDSTQVTEYFAEVWKISPIFGFGFAPYEVIDNGFLWAFASGGILGLAVFVSMLYRALTRARKLLRYDAEPVFPLMMLGLAVFGALGAPSFTINRASTVFWTLYPLATIVGLSRRPRATTPVDTTIG